MFFQLFESESKRIESILKQFGVETIASLLHVYCRRDIANHIGLFLRLYTNSAVSLSLTAFTYLGIAALHSGHESHLATLPCDS